MHGQATVASITFSFVIGLLDHIYAYSGETGGNDALVQRNAGHRCERAVSGASDRGHRGRLGDSSRRQPVTLQLNDPLVKLHVLLLYICYRQATYYTLQF